MIALLPLALASAAPEAATAVAWQEGRWSIRCPVEKKRHRPLSCATSIRVPDVEIVIRSERLRDRIEVHTDARDPFSGERCEWALSTDLPDGPARADAGALAGRLNQSITLLIHAYECRPSQTPQLGRADGEHLIRFLALARAALAARTEEP